MPTLSEVRFMLPRDQLLRIKREAKADQRTVASWFRMLVAKEFNAKGDESLEQEKKS